jgi:hypothetical protein
VTFGSLVRIVSAAATAPTLLLLELFWAINNPL